LPLWWLARSCTGLATGCRGLLLRLRQRHEVSVGDRIFVLLPQELLFDQQVDRWRIRVGELLLKHPDGMSDLLAAEDELFFLFPLDHLFPHRHGHGHHHGHHRNPDDQGRHGIASLRGSSGAMDAFALTS
jgi:hypothetical protein